MRDDGSTLSSPGPNYWSGDSSLVWRDSDGFLHFAVRNIGGKWYCSEVYLEFEAMAYGIYIYKVKGRFDKQDAMLVGGWFTYDT